MPDGLNKVMLIGNLDAEPEMRYTANGSALTTFRIGVKRTFGPEGERRQSTDWFRIVAWAELAEFLGQNLQPGSRVFVSGRLSTRSWTDENGQKRYRTEVVVNRALILEGNRNDESEGQANDQSADALSDGLNETMVIGNLGQKPELRYTASGNALTRFNVAVNRTLVAEGQRREETEWFRVVAWSKLAELADQHLDKGRRVYVEGRLANRSWDGQDGEKHYATELVANQVLFLDRPQGTQFPDIAGDIDPDDLPFE